MYARVKVLNVGADMYKTVVIVAPNKDNVIIVVNRILFIIVILLVSVLVLSSRINIALYIRD